MIPRNLLVAATAALTLAFLLFLLGVSTTARAADDTSAVPGQLIVGFTGDTSSAESKAIVNGTDAAIAKRLPDNTAVVKVDAGQSASEVQSALDARGDVAFVEPNFKVHSENLTNDPKLRDGGLWGIIRIHAPAAWSTTRGAGVIVAVLDSGYAIENPDLTGAAWENTNEIPNGKDDDNDGFVDDIYGADWVDHDGVPNDAEGHGSHVAGTIAATADDGNGVVGVAPDARVMPLKFLDKDGAGSVADAIGAIDFAIKHGAKVINASWGGPDYSQALEGAISRAGQAGIIFVAAAGNDGTNNDVAPDYPAAMSLPNIVSVAASDKQDNLASFSNYGKSSVDVAAPGVGIISTVGDHTESWSGTSMATPHVAGVAALLASVSPGASAEALAGAIIGGARTSSPLIGKIKSGGILDVVGSFKALGLDTSNFEAGSGPSAFRLKKPGKKVMVGRGGKVRFTWSRSYDDDLIGYEVYVDGKLKTTVRSPSDDSGIGAPNTFAKVKIKAGKHRWSVVAVDGEGNVRTATRTFGSKGKVAVFSRHRG
jgi:subtilisin family serine protease